MKQLLQNIKKNSLTIEELPLPVCKSGGVLVKTVYSAISVGTEVMKLKNGELSYLQMARKKPEQVKEVLNTLTQMGPAATYRKVMNKLDAFSPLGYSLAGEVIEVGQGVQEFRIGDMVACGGAGFANHSEVNFVPKNLCTKIPGNVDPKEAAFTTIASIALQGFRQTESAIGENVAVIGLGLLGQILVQLINANGCRVFGFDLSPEKCELARKNGAYFAETASKNDFEKEIKALTNGLGCDSVIITTGTTSNDPIILAGKIARDKAKIVDIGITKMDLPWELYYRKELDFRFSRSYGPGRYDPVYENQGVDYPPGYVRWTLQRNMDAILQLLNDKKLDFGRIISHEFNFSEAENAFSSIKESKEAYLGVVLKYPSDIDTESNRIELKKAASPAAPAVKLGLIGAGNYASTMLLPFLRSKSKMVGIATATGINAKDKARKYGFEYATTDYLEMLSDPDINTALIATRHNQHARMVVDALEKGKHVYVEKPMAISLEELKAIKETYDPARQILMVGHNRRFAPSVRFLKRQLKPAYPYSVYYQINAGFIPKDNWYQDPSQGGRIIGEVGHFVDTLQFLLDADPVEVYANTTSLSHMPEQDNSFITIKFDNGSSAVIAYLADGDKKYPKEKIMISGYQNTHEFDNFRTVTSFKGGKTKKKKFLSIDKGQKQEMAALVGAVQKGSNPVSFQSLLLNALSTIVATESIKNNKPYPINLGLLQ